MEMTHLKELLVAKGKTQSDLAAALGRDKSAITNLLQGKRQLKAAEIPVIALFLKVSEAEVLGIAPDGLAEPASIPFQGAPSQQAIATGHVIEKDGQFYVQESSEGTQNCFALEVRDRALDLEGLLPGDIVLCEPVHHAKEGDVIIVQHYSDDGSAQTVLRRYQPPFLETHSTRQGFARLHEERANVAIMARVVRLMRYY